MIADLAMQRALDRMGQVGFSRLTEEEKTLAAIWYFESEVANGGFEKYFKSSGGDTAAYAPTALRAVGANIRAEIAEQGNAVFGSAGVPTDRARRIEMLQSLPAEARRKFDQLETRFYDRPTDLDERLEAYLARRARPTA